MKTLESCREDSSLILNTYFNTYYSSLSMQVRAIAECPCIYREADPLFPGAGGYRWDCEYVSHGLVEVPTACWAENSNVTQVL